MPYQSLSEAASTPFFKWHLALNIFLSWGINLGFENANLTCWCVCMRETRGGAVVAVVLRVSAVAVRWHGVEFDCMHVAWLVWRGR